MFSAAKKFRTLFHSRPRSADQHGFGLLETMVAMGLVSAIGLGIATMLTQQSRASRSIASTMDATQLERQLTSYAQNPKGCPRLFGSAAPGTFDFDPAAVPAQVLSLTELKDTSDAGTGPKVLEINRQPKSSLFTITAIKLMLDPTAATPKTVISTTGTGRVRYRMILKVEATKLMPNELTNPNIHYHGGNYIRPIELSMMLDATTDGSSVLDCSLSSGSGSGQSCSVAGESYVALPGGGYGCRTATCPANQFPVGMDVTGGNAGGAHCCANGEHVAGTLDGNPMCCGDGRFLQNDGTCSSPSQTICPAGQSAKSVFPDGSANCCIRQVKWESGDEAKNYCALDRVVENPRGECDSGGIKFVRVDVYMGQQQIHVRCEDNDGAKATNDCCKVVYAPSPNVNSPAVCTPPDVLSGNACVSCTSTGGYVDSMNNCAYCGANETWDGTACVCNYDSNGCNMCSESWCVPSNGITPSSCIPNGTYCM